MASLVMAFHMPPVVAGKCRSEGWRSRDRPYASAAAIAASIVKVKTPLEQFMHWWARPHIASSIG